MNDTKIYVTPVVICLIVMVWQGCDASLAHLETDEKCVIINQCEPVMRLLRIPMIKRKIFKEVRQAQCGSDGANVKIYCDVKKIIYRPERFDAVVDAHSEAYTTTAVPPPIDPLTTSIDKHPNFRLLEHDICGPVSANYRNQLKTRIVGGRVTDIDEFPWMALLAYEEMNSYDTKPQYRCGGTVINRNHVLTAAHCVTNLQGRLQLISVRIGEHDLATKEDCNNDNKCNAKYEDFDIDTVYYHYEFSSVSLRNDIAIIRLNASIDFTRTQVRPICLPIETDQQAPPKSGVVAGWGSTQSDFPGSQSLLKVTLPIVPTEECDAAYVDAISYTKIWPKQFCAGGLKGLDSCTGDSGGPLQSVAKYRGDVRMVQRGIVSYGKKDCGLEGTPGVYTSVAHYIRWILDTIGS